jgi:cephalosporin hydroxylase
MSEYQFTVAWFSPLIQSVWNTIVPQQEPKTFLEIGSFEGRSATWIINKFSRIRDIEMHCIDTWAGCDDNKLLDIDFKVIEERFKHNTELACKNNPFKTDFHVHKGASSMELAKLYVNGFADYFDFIYVDADHSAAGCLSDMVLAWKLLKHSGLMIVDDYLFAIPNRPRWDVPKTGADAFVNIYVDTVWLETAPNNQLYIRKIKPNDLVWGDKTF